MLFLAFSESNRTRTGRRLLALASITAAFAFQSGCSSTVQGGAKSAEGNPNKRDTEVKHEPCDLKSAKTMDANGDGKPDVWEVWSGSHLECRAVDLNFDGRVDSYIYYDSNGQVRRRERDYDRDGKIEEISIYQGGALTETDRSTTLADRLDTWSYYQGGKITKAERDSDGDGIVDQWWEYPPGNEKCPLIHSDVDGDGRPDPGATIDYCKQTGYVPPTRSGPQEVKHTFERPGNLPEEMENKEAPAGTGGASGSESAPKGEKK
jgi:hypothetical protein